MMSTLAADHHGSKSGHSVAASSTITFEIVTDPRALEALERDWDALYDRAAQPYFSQSFIWCWTSWQTVSQPRRRKLHCLVGRYGDRVVVIWPFVLHRLALWWVARPLGPEATEYSSVLVEDGPEIKRHVAAAWNALRRSLSCDVILVPFVHVGSTLNQVLSDERMPAYIEVDHTSYVTWREHPSWESYYSSVDSKMRREVKRTRRRLAEQGLLTFTHAAETDECPTIIAWALRKKVARLTQRHRRNGWMRKPEYQSFLNAIASQSGPSGRLIVSVLKSNDRIIAVDLCTIDRFRIEAFFTVFDSAFRVFGPGQLVMEDGLRCAFAQSREYDLRLGSEAYKKHWANGSSDVFSYVFGNSLWGVAYIFYRTATHRISHLRFLVPPKARRAIKAAIGKTRPMVH